MKKVSTRITTQPGVASSSPVGIASCSAVETVTECHGLEHQVRRELLSNPQLNFSSLVIHRVKDGVCLEGVLEVDGSNIDVCEVTRGVAGVDQVINRLVQHHMPSVDE